MTYHRPRSHLATHAVDNQPAVPQDYNAWNTDRALREAVARAAPEWVAAWLARLGGETGRVYWFEQAALANRYVPALEGFDAQGQRVDEVSYHPAYHALMNLAIGQDLHAIAWRREGQGGHVAHVAGMYLFTQPEQGACCPVTMTHAAVPALRREPDVANAWLPRLMSNAYDSRSLPVADKTGATLGMAMTEKQGGSDVQANTTRARPGPTAGEYTLGGHKWFCSAPMSDGFLTLAQLEEGLTCFLVPRWRPDGSRNSLEIQRLKDKCGNRSNASAEIEFHDTWAQRVGEAGHGVRTIIEMVQQTRLDAATAPVGMMRQALVQACHHCCGRKAFGALLIEQPLMQQVLADLALEVEAATAMVIRVAQACDRGGEDGQERLLARLATAVAKYWTNKRAPSLIYEAMECLGGNGYVETSILARLYREAPVNSIWEGSGNVICLDVLRAIEREPETVPAFLREVECARGIDERLDAMLDRLRALLAAGGGQRRARALTEVMALTLQGSLLLRYAPAVVAEGFCTARLDPLAGATFGASPELSVATRILERVY